MSGLRAWWNGLSLRERWLIGIMLAIAGVLVLWLGMVRPLERGIVNGWIRYGEAVDTNASVRGAIAILRGLPERRTEGATGAMDQIVSQSAAEAGLTLDRGDVQGGGRMAIAIGSARSGALLLWLSGLQARGIGVETISMTPGTTPGTVAVQAVLRGAS